MNFRHSYPDQEQNKGERLHVLPGENILEKVPELAGQRVGGVQIRWKKPGVATVVESGMHNSGESTIQLWGKYHDDAGYIARYVGQLKCMVFGKNDGVENLISSVSLDHEDDVIIFFETDYIGTLSIERAPSLLYDPRYRGSLSGFEWELKTYPDQDQNKGETISVAAGENIFDKIPAIKGKHVQYIKLQSAVPAVVTALFRFSDAGPVDEKTVKIYFDERQGYVSESCKVCKSHNCETGVTEIIPCIAGVCLDRSSKVILTYLP